MKKSQSSLIIRISFPIPHSMQYIKPFVNLHFRRVVSVKTKNLLNNPFDHLIYDIRIYSMMMVEEKIVLILFFYYWIYLDLPDRSCVFYINHPENWSTGNVREFFSQWTLLSYDRMNLTTHAIAVSLKKD